MTPTQAPAVLLIVTIVGWLLLLTPSIAYIITGWACRRDRLLDFLTGDVLRTYYGLFDPGHSFGSDEEYSQHFRKRFNRRYGRRHYAFPILLLAVLSGVGLWAATETIRAKMMGVTTAVALPPVVVASMLGAYVWVVWDQLARLRNRDFTIHDVYGCSFRILMSLPLGYFLAAGFPNAVGPPLAFFLGGFPTQVLFKIIRRNAGKTLGLNEQENDKPTELIKLQGTSLGTVERFQEEGITTICELAWTEPVDLAIRTNFDFDYVVDCQSQALLWVYFDEDAEKLFPFMIRGAMEVAEMFGAPRDGGPKIELAPPETIDAAAVKLGMDPRVLSQTLLEIARDPYNQILCSMWYPEWQPDATTPLRTSASSQSA
ncbi:MAG TPA: hypothetical protein VL332_01985 [Candidatus Saccharimonadaceae bacterium]|jgi:hypothetical protein|nr:hypothetical protein [Candidatus Saccharimonadaceae bacterium]